MKKLNKEELEGIAKAQARKIKGLEVRIEDWIHELAYYTEEKVATPKGVKKFIGKALDDKVKEIKELREENKELKIMLVDLQEAYNEPKTQPNALKASEVKPKPLSKQLIEQFKFDGKMDYILNEMESDIKKKGYVKPLSKQRIAGIVGKCVCKYPDRVSVSEIAEALYKEMNNVK